MPFEVPLLMDLGFEVFTPKIIPDAKTSGFRSGAVNFSYDEGLSIPKRILDKLNSFNFYEKVWPAEIVSIVNRYFGTAFIMPHAIQVEQAVRKFEGKLVFRTFGLENTKTYKWVLEIMHGYEIFSKIHSIRNRFWFGEGYQQLHECEPPLFADRALYLPIGLPNYFWKNKDKWRGSNRRILFVCPNIITNSYYAEIYRDFKKTFGDLPHAIIGAQDVEVDDPNVLGFVDDEELESLYLESAVLYYHSIEQRHVHYSPIEAAINGLPVIYFKSSLLGRMADDLIAGAVETEAEAREKIEAILAGDEVLINRLRNEQHTLAYKFSYEYCRPIWQKNLDALALMAELPQSRKWHVFAKEVKRFALTPVANGLASLQPYSKLPSVPRAMLTMPFEEQGSGKSLEDGIDFRMEHYPLFVNRVSGISAQEFWGRWTDGKKAVIHLEDELKGEFQLVITGGAYGKNIGVPFKIRIGKTVRTAKFSLKADQAETIVVNFLLPKPADFIEFKIPYPESPPNDARHVGFGFIEIKIMKLNH